MVAYIVNQTPTYVAFFRAAKVGKTGLTVTVTVRRGGAVLASAAAATEVGDGWYSYAAGGSSVPGVCTATFHTTDTTVDAQDVEDRAYFGMATAAGITQDAGLPGGLTLTRDIIQRFVKTLHGVRGTVWFVHPDGLDTNDGLSPATALQTPSLKGTDGAAPALSGDLVYILDDVPITAVFKLPNGASLRGAGGARLRQTTAATDVVEVGSNSRISDLRLQGTQNCIVNNGRAVTETVIERVRATDPATTQGFVFFGGFGLVRDTQIVDCQVNVFGNVCVFQNLDTNSFIVLRNVRGRSAGVSSGVYINSGYVVVDHCWIENTFGASVSLNCEGGTINAQYTKINGGTSGADISQAGGYLILTNVSGSGSGGLIRATSFSAPANIIYRDALGGSEWELNGTVAAATSGTSFTLSAEFPATANALQYQALVFLSGALKGQTQRINTYSAGRVATFARGFTATPAVGDRVKVIGVVE